MVNKWSMNVQSLYLDTSYSQGER